MFGLPIDYVGLTYRTQSEIVFFRVLFLEDFGIFKKDTQVPELIFNVANCTIEVRGLYQELKLVPCYE